MRQAFSIVLAAGASLLSASALAQGYPAKPIRVLVGQATGGGTDLERTEAVFRQCLGRKPDPEEARSLLSLLEAAPKDFVPIAGIVNGLVRTLQRQRAGPVAEVVQKHLQTAAPALVNPYREKLSEDYFIISIRRSLPIPTALSAAPSTNSDRSRRRRTST